MIIRIEANLDDISIARRMLTEIAGGADRAIVRAVNETLGNVRVRCARDVGARINLSAARIKTAITVKKTDVSNQSAWVAVSGDPVPLVEYDARQLAKGVSVKISRAGGRVFFPHAFLADMNGNQMVASRNKSWCKSASAGINYAMLPKRYRFPVKVLYGPSIPAVVEEHILDDLEQYAADRLAVNLNAEVDAVLRGY